jgi:hypothetical protein
MPNDIKGVNRDAEEIDIQGLQNSYSLTNIISALFYHQYKVITVNITRKKVTGMKNGYKILVGMHEESRRHWRTEWSWNYEERWLL